MITTIYSKPLLNGGREFLIYNDLSKFWARGNTYGDIQKYLFKRAK